MEDIFWENKKVLVTGGAGFIGSHLLEKLVKRGARVTVLDNLDVGKLENLKEVKNNYEYIRGNCKNLNTAQAACRKQDIVMNLAARVRGIDYNKAHQGTMLMDNLLMETVMIEAARKAGVERFLMVSSACVYPENCSVPTPESEGFMGEPESANGGYGWAKRIGELLGRYYGEEFGMKVAIVRPYNCYGPRDHFEPEPFHVIPALIKRVLSGENPVVVWGSGKQTRAFLYVEDLVEGMTLATEKYAVSDPVNLGTDEEVTVKKLVETIIKASGKDASIVFDTTKPDGSQRRNSDNKKAKEKLGFQARTTLEVGLKKTIEWYQKTICL